MQKINSDLPSDLFMHMPEMAKAMVDRSLDCLA